MNKITSDLWVLAVIVVAALLFTPPLAGGSTSYPCYPADSSDCCGADSSGSGYSRDLGICDTLYVETFDCDHFYDATGGYDSVRVAIYVTHDSNTFWWSGGSRWVQDSILAFVIPLNFWKVGCADSVVFPTYGNWNNNVRYRFDPKFSRSMFRHLFNPHTGVTDSNRFAQMNTAGYDDWDIVMDVVQHDPGHVFLAMQAYNTRGWWQGSRVLLATLTFLVYGLDEDCDSTKICLDSTSLPPGWWMTFVRYDAAWYIPRHFLPYCSTIKIPGPGIQATSPVQNALNVPVSTNISVTFNTPMNPATINHSTFIVDARSTGRHILGWIDYDDPTRTATFIPALEFDEGEVVTVVLTTGIESSTGRHLAGYAWSFTTVAKRDCTFTPHLDYAAGDGPVSVFAGDLDGDGDLDLATANANSNNVSVLLNPGNATFPSHTEYAVGTGPVSVFAGDLDGDGYLDLATANANSNNVSVLLNPGNATFPSHTEYAVGTGPVSVFASDLDNDGDLDLASANLVSNKVSVLLNNGNGTFAPRSDYPVGVGPYSVLAADLDGDGYLDLATANVFSDSVSVLLNLGNGTFGPHSVYPVGDGPYSVFAGDVDGDGDLDLTTANTGSNNVSVLLNNGNGSFNLPSLYPVGHYPASVFAADLDGSGKLDLVATNHNDDSVSVLLNNGNGTFAPDVVFQVGDAPFGVFAADLDGNGTLDLVTSNRDSDNLSVLLNFLRGDCNSDGVIDIADVVYLLNYLFINGPAPQPLEAGDATCDGVVDASDVVYLLNYLFVGGPPPSC
jgi:hypothetical protein